MLKRGHVRKYIRNNFQDSEMWRWRRMEKIILTVRVKNDEVLHEVQGERENLRTIKRGKANWTGDILCRTRY